MTKLLLAIFGFIFRNLGALLTIVAVLLLGSWLQREWQQLANAQNDLQRQQRIERLLVKQHQELIKAQQKTQKASQTLISQYEQAKQQANTLQQQLQQWREERQTLWDEHWVARKNPMSAVSLEIRQYDIKIAALSGQLRASQATVKEWQNKVMQSPVIAKNKQLQQQLQESEQVLAQVKQSITQAESFVQTSLVNRLHLAIMQVLPTALWILAGLILLPIIIKLWQYFVVAPLVSRLPPIRILDAPSEPSEPIRVSSHEQHTGHVSAHSLTVHLPPSHELLLHPNYLQSFSKQAQKSTQWFLNASIPLSSWAAGLVTLVRLESTQDETLQLASMHNPLEELVILNLPQGASLVCKPRCLAGVIQHKGQKVHISRHWRLFNLHSWLTLQLRYLVFHGQCQLIIKGHHGVILEPAGAPRLIQQNATLGFSSHIAYSNYRCETFVSYYLGKDSLFNDQFSGTSGIYFYEQAPSATSKTAAVHKAVGGVWDAILKVFGI